MLILNIFYLEHQPFNLSYAQTIFLLHLVGIFGAILGNARPNGWFADKSLTYIMKRDILLTIVIRLVGLLDLPSGLIITFSGAEAYMVGKFNPKINAFWAQNVSENQLAQVKSLISTMAMAAIPLGATLFSALAIFSLTLTWFVFLVLALIAAYLIYTQL